MQPRISPLSIIRIIKINNKFNLHIRCTIKYKLQKFKEYWFFLWNCFFSLLKSMIVVTLSTCLTSVLTLEWISSQKPWNHCEYWKIFKQYLLFFINMQERINTNEMHHQTEVKNILHILTWLLVSYLFYQNSSCKNHKIQKCWKLRIS